MQNTDDHAYTNKDLANIWYLESFKNEQGVVFNFFDNGQGIIKTAKRKIIDKVLEQIGLEESNILMSALKGNLRSRTGLSNRNKGLPQIKSFLDNNYVPTYMLLTNRIKLYKSGKIVKTEKLKYNFNGTFLIWLFEKDKNE